MTSLLERLCKSPDAKVERTYDLVKKTFKESYEFESYEGIADARISNAFKCEIDRGGYFPDVSYFIYRGKYFTAVKKRNGESVDVIIEIDGRRHTGRTDYDYGPKPTLPGVDENLWPTILKNREHVIDLIAEKYGLERPWNDHSGFVYLLKKNIIGTYDAKGKRKQHLDEKGVVKRLEEFMHALSEWATNDPSC
ncbi:MAG: hypothetical protein Q7J54_08020 [Candidatus Woesearchaeota archaeon]|nr:hypothetical protein [Candidatus Woesearchaeota archaeon]